MPKIKIGKYKGRYLEVVMFRDPSHFLWIVNEPNPSGALLELQGKARSLLYAFNHAVICFPCQKCHAPATHGWAHREQPFNFDWFCDNCHKPGHNSNYRRLQYYGDVDAKFWKKDDYLEVVRELAIAKGLIRFNEYAVKKYFSALEKTMKSEEIINWGKTGKELEKILREEFVPVDKDLGLVLPEEEELTVEMEAQWEAERQRMQEEADIEAQMFRDSHREMAQRDAKWERMKEEAEIEAQMLRDSRRNSE